MVKGSRLDNLLFITENPTSPDDLSRAGAIGAELVRLDALHDHERAHDSSLVFNVDLRSIDNVLLLKEQLKHHGLGIRIFLIDPDTRVTIVHANVLGADGMLPRSANAADIMTLIDTHLGRQPTLSSAESIAISISAGVEALDISFKAIVANAALDNENVLQAGAQIAEAIGEVGVEDWLATVRGHHGGTFQHCMLVTGVAAAFGTQSGMARSDVLTLTVTGLLHDIGKALVPIELLDKPGALTPDETTIMRRHPVSGYEYLSKHSKIAGNVVRSVRHHHEFLDGSGYPDHLQGTEIDDLTRIVTICDIYAALIERRSYKPPKSPASAIQILTLMAQEGKVETSLVRQLGRIMLPA